ncbi:flavohemoglobin expression-modulating QEGLA motif protein, partial [Patescibacteria group bacterium]|nr:flavohemoglobin expression-modulating QEGLA motif protein [Patescibacteria group bacterium]
KGEIKMIIGNRDTKGFLIDPSISNKGKAGVKKEPQEDQKETQKINYSHIDQDLIRIDGKIKLLYHLRPINLESEREKFKNNPTENPQFEYPQLKFDPVELITELKDIKTDSSPIGKAFEAKKEEIQNKIKLLENIDEESFTATSIKLFGKPSQEEVDECQHALKEIPKTKEGENSLYTADEAKKHFEEAFEKYGLKSWKIKIKDSMVADCVAGKNNRLFIRKNAKFSLERIKSLIIHEIETHILTAQNGKLQPYEIFNTGLANYLETQEGLAMYNVSKQRHTPFIKNDKALTHVIAISKALEGSFLEVYNEALKFGASPDTAFRSALKAKRGIMDTSKRGAFTKDYIYYKGYKKIEQFMENGGDLKDLYIGKFNIDDIDTIKKIPGIIKARHLPGWLN